MMRQREEIIRTWLDMWLGEDLSPLEAIFADDVEYTECWGNQYCGKAEITRWFGDWHRHNRMETWEPEQFIHAEDKTVVTWRMHAVTTEGVPREMDGVYIIEWADGEKIKALREYRSDPEQKRPYGG